MCVVGVCARARVCVCVRACVCVRGVRVQLLDQFEADDELWVGIVNSSTPGKAFCAGADLKEVGKGQNIASDKGGFAGIVKYPRTKPLICAVGLCTHTGHTRGTHVTVCMACTGHPSSRVLTTNAVGGSNPPSRPGRRSRARRRLRDRPVVRPARGLGSVQLWRAGGEAEPDPGGRGGLPAPAAAPPARRA